MFPFVEYYYFLKIIKELTKQATKSPVTSDVMGLL